MVSDDYQLVPRDELEKLKKEVADLKGRPPGDFETSANLLHAMDRLSGQIARLVRLFEEADKQLYEEYGQKHNGDNKLDRLIDQNQKIARGVLAVADLIQKEPPATKAQYPLAQPQEPTETTASPAPQEQPIAPSVERERPKRPSLEDEIPRELGTKSRREVMELFK
jgi:hypothetical protein